MTHNAPGEMIQRPRILRVCASAPTPASKPCFKPKGIYLYSNIARVLTDQIPHVFSAFSSFVPLASVSVNDMQPPQKVNEQDACMSIPWLASVVFGGWRESPSGVPTKRLELYPA